MNVELTDKEKVKILNSDDIFAIMQKVLLREDKIDQDREHFWILGLANNNRLLFIELISMGTVKKTLVEPMEVFSFALQKRAVKIILVHNHPSGELKPSKSDLDITDRLIQVGIIVDTQVLDHIIITTQSYMSFEDERLMYTLRKSTKYVPPYILAERIKKEAKDFAKKKAAELAKKKKEIEEKALNKGKIESAKKIAKELKKQGISADIISQTTGLSLKEIEKLGD